MKTERSTRSRKVKGIFRRGNIFWLSCVENGNRIQKSLGTSDYVEAVAKAAEIRANPLLTFSEPLRSEIATFIAGKLKDNVWSRNSAETKRHILLAFADAVNKYRVEDIRAEEIQRFYDSYSGRVADSTREGYIMTIRSFFSSLTAGKKIRENPTKDLKLAKIDRKGRTAFCKSEIRDKLIAEAPNDDLRFVLFCGFHAGLRKGEIIEARPSWFNIDRGSLEIKATDTFRPKDRDARTVPLTKAFREFLEKYGLRHPYMLRPDVEPGRSRYRYDFRLPWDRYMKQQDASWVTPHIMRHTFASLLAIAGVSIYKIALWLGDDVRVVQNHYAKLLPQDSEIEKAFG